MRPTTRRWRSTCQRRRGRRGASLDHLISYRCESSADQADEQLICEAVSKRQRFGRALLAPEQLQCPARFPAETALSRGRRHIRGPIRSPQRLTPKQNPGRT